MSYKNKDEQYKCQQRWYKRNKDTIQARHRRNEDTKKRWLAKYKASLKCSRCPENHPACLDFHHRDPLDKEQNVAALPSQGWSINRILKEIQKCDVL